MKSRNFTNEREPVEVVSKGAELGMAKNLVAKVADSANVSAAERAAVLVKLPEYVSSAAGELGLLSLRPSENKTEKRRKSGKKERKAQNVARRDRAIGSGPKGELLRAIYVRIAMWIAQTAIPVTVVASDEDIIQLLPHLISSASIRRIAGRKSEQLRTVSQMAFDWRAVIGPQATRTAEDTNVAVTFYLDGNADTRRFSIAVDAASARIIERPIAGMTPPISLSTIIEETKVFRAPFMEWAELTYVAARDGNPVAMAAIMTTKAVKTVAKGTGYTLAGLVLAALLFFAVAPRSAQARVIEAVRRWLNEWSVKNETPDGRLPERLRLDTPPALSNEDTEVRFLSDTEAVLTLRRPEEKLRRIAQSDPAFVGAHVEWEWRVTVGKRPAICKHTENPQLHVLFDPTMAHENVSSSVAPLIVRHSVLGPFTVGVPGPAGPLVPPQPGYFDQSDVLVVADARTHSTCVVPTRPPLPETGIR